MTAIQPGIASAHPARFRLRRVAPGAFVRHGATAGMLVALAPGLAFAVFATYLVRTARLTLETWRSVRIPLPLNQSATVNMIDLLQFGPLLGQLRTWDGAAWLLPAALTLASLAAGAVLGAAVSLVLVLLLNVTARAGGGLTLELERVPDA